MVNIAIVHDRVAGQLTKKKQDVKSIKLSFTYCRSKRARDDIVHTSSRNVAIAEQVTILPLSPQNLL